MKISAHGPCLWRHQTDVRLVKFFIHFPSRWMAKAICRTGLVALMMAPVISPARTYAPSSAEPSLEAVLRIQEKQLSQSSQLNLKAGLFHYWQEQHLEGLKIATQDPSQQIATTDKIMLGQMMVAWGLLEDAEKVFAVALADVPSSDANIIWMHLAQKHFEAGSVTQALAVVKQHVRKPSYLLESEINLLKAMSYVEQLDFRNARKALESIPSLVSLSPYSLFNAATAYSKIGNTQKATELFDALMSIPENSPELELIRDRATLALGLMFLRENNGEYAALALEEVRQKSPYVNLALLAKGWAHLQNKEWNDAYNAWHTLANYQHEDMAIIEARANLPTLFIQKGDLENAMHFLNKAQASLAQTHKQLQTEYQSVSADNWLKPLQARIKQKLNADSLQLSAALKAGYERYQEIQDIQQTTHRWSTTLKTLNDWVKQRIEQLYQDQASVEMLLINLTTNNGIEANLDTITHRFKILNNQGSTWSHASSDQAELKKQLNILRKETEKLDKKNPVRELLLTRVKRLEGLLVWDVIQSEENIIKSVQDKQDELTNRMKQARDELLSLKHKQHTHLERLRSWQNTFIHTHERLVSLQQQTTAMKQEQERQLKRLYIADLDNISQHLANVEQRLSLTNATIIEENWSQKATGTDIAHTKKQANTDLSQPSQGL